MKAKIIQTIGEKIDGAKEGRSQKWIVRRMRELGCEKMTEVYFSKKKEGIDMVFDEKELQVLSKILSVNL